MQEREIIYNIAFSFIKNINANIIREILEREISKEEFFSLPTQDLIRRLGIKNNHEFDRTVRDEALLTARSEWEKIRKHGIKPLFLLDEDYPALLGEIEDAPIILYQLGETNLNDEHFVSIVGTRKPTKYGIDFCSRFVEEISAYFPNSTIVSGLAYGIDAEAHKASLNNSLPTVATVAHGLNMIYPAAHRNLAKEIIKKGGSIISEYPFDTNPYRPHFLARNRIVAGISEATVVVESNIKGGAMSTANFAFMYNRDVMALPGRSTDEVSRGCNLLIRKNKAHLIETAADLIEVTGWEPLNVKLTEKERVLFPELVGEAKTIYEYLQYNSQPVQIDQICTTTGLPIAKLTGILNDLEFEGIIIRHPGNRYSIS